MTDIEKSVGQSLLHNQRLWNRVNELTEHYQSEPMSDLDMELENKEIVIPCIVRELCLDFKSLLNVEPDQPYIGGLLPSA
jgi:hypothetical protein